MKKLSQSLYKKLRYEDSVYRTIRENKGCNAKELALYQLKSEEPFEVYAMPLLDNNWQVQAPSLLMLLGLEFERMLIGASRSGNEQAHQIPRNKNGSMKVDEMRMISAVEQAKVLVKSEEIKFTAIQPRWETEFWVGHPDAPHGFLQGVEVNFDIKYTKIKKAREGKLPPSADYFYNEYHPWYEGLKIQADTYTVMDYSKTGKILPFYFLIFRPFGEEQEITISEGKKATYQPYMLDLRRVDYSLKRNIERLERYANEMHEVGKLFATGAFPKSKNPSYDNCANCPFKCSVRVSAVDYNDLDMF